MESILTSIKKLLGIEEDYEHFDVDIITHINSVLNILTQLGIGSKDGYSITDRTQTWEDFLGKGAVNVNAVRTYVYLKVRLLFDPPTSSAAVESINRLAGEMEWRLNVTAETPKDEST